MFGIVWIRFEWLSRRSEVCCHVLPRAVHVVPGVLREDAKTYTGLFDRGQIYDKV